MKNHMIFYFSNYDFLANVLYLEEGKDIDYYDIILAKVYI